jgi:hypothetical protein
MKKRSVVGLNLWENHRFMVLMREMDLEEALSMNALNPWEIPRWFRGSRIAFRIPEPL